MRLPTMTSETSLHLGIFFLEPTILARDKMSTLPTPQEIEEWDTRTALNSKTLSKKREFKPAVLSQERPKLIKIFMHSIQLGIEITNIQRSQKPPQQDAKSFLFSPPYIGRLSRAAFKISTTKKSFSRI